MKKVLLYQVRKRLQFNSSCCQLIQNKCSVTEQNKSNYSSIQFLQRDTNKENEFVICCDPPVH